MATPAVYGSKGPLVVQLQHYLKNKGFNPGSIDGVWGPKTQAAVDAFKKKGGGVPWDELQKKAGTSSGGGGGTAPSKNQDNLLGPDLLNQFEHAEAQLDFDYKQEKDSILLDRTLAHGEKNRALAALTFERDQKLTQLMRVFGQEIRKQPEEFAARGLYRSGLLRTQVGELRSEHRFQRGQLKQATTFNRGQVKSKFLSQMSQLDQRLKQLKQSHSFGQKELGFSKTAKQQQIASELRTYGVS